VTPPQTRSRLKEERAMEPIKLITRFVQFDADITSARLARRGICNRAVGQFPFGTDTSTHLLGASRIHSNRSCPELQLTHYLRIIGLDGCLRSVFS